jgi:hypothetical protein
MATEYTETVAPDDDAETRVLGALADDMPYVFVVATSLEPLNLRVDSQHGVDVIRSLLKQTLKALPGGEGGS